MSPTKDFWNAAGVALVIFAICLGVGSCGALLNATGGCPDTHSTHGEEK